MKETRRQECQWVGEQVREDHWLGRSGWVFLAESIKLG